MINYNMQQIDMNRIRETLPKHGTAVLKKEIKQGKSVVSIVCKVENPSLGDMYPMTWEKDFQMIKDWQKQIVGEALSEIYTLTEGSRWIIYLNRIQMEFINTTDEEIKSYSGFTVEELTKR